MIIIIIIIINWDFLNNKYKDIVSLSSLGLRLTNDNIFLVRIQHTF